MPHYFCRLVVAVENGSVSETHEILRKYHDPLQGKDSIKFTYLHAISKDSIDIVKLFDEYGLGYTHSDSIEVSGLNETPLTQALTFACPNVVSYLISQIEGKVFKDALKEGDSPLHILITSCYSVTDEQISCLHELMRCSSVPKDCIVEGQNCRNGRKL